MKSPFFKITKVLSYETTKELEEPKPRGRHPTNRSNSDLL